ncbi:MAG TPA: amino acid adenylation domain-containing protein, partial [Candidatus Kapabacteria bacterium]|nr:amino acid adenylation domain-containing protein [Candidatus Kapabacteria bacterium]
GLRQLSLKTGSTVYMVLLAAFNILLWKLTGQEDIVVGSPTAGRRRHDFEQIMGMFVNTLVLRNTIRGEMSFKEFLAEIKECTLNAHENQDYQYEDLVGKVVETRDLSRNPLFDVVFALENKELNRVLVEMTLPGLEVKRYEYEETVSKFDLTLFAREEEENFSFAIEYSTRLFKKETIERFTAYFKRILDGVREDRGKPVSKIDILADEEKRQLLIDFNQTRTAYPADKAIAQLFEEQVAWAPDHIAIVGAGPRVCPLNLTYRQLNAQSNRWAGLLIEKGAEPDTVVAIMMERSVEMIIGLLGILKAGGAYLPIDPEYPQERIDYMLKDSGARILINKSEIQNPKLRVQTNSNDQKGRPRRGLSNFDIRTSNFNSSNLAYIIYTSGSTGQPKGVMVNDRNVVRLVKNTNFVPLTSETRILQTCAPVFDVSTFEIWGSLLNGGELVVTEKEAILNTHWLSDALRNYRINTLWLSSPLFNRLIQEDNELFAPLRYLLAGGDVLSPGLISKARCKFPDLKIINGYGPTENTTFSTTYSVEREFTQSIPIGRPVANSLAYIVDKTGNLQPAGVAGELWVGGAGVARGYLNNPELTAKKFIDFHHSSFIIHHAILYRTGDLARWLPDGNIEFLGRMDQQLKIRGFRVELGEIENELIKYKDVKDAVVVSQEDKTGDKYLCAYFVPHSTNIPEAEDLTTYLAKFLPGYMIPLHFLAIEKIPLNVNGKVDRKALPRPGILDTGRNYTAPRDEMEEKLVELWSLVLGVESGKIGIDDHFFRLGGQSLKLIILAARIHKEFDVMIAISKFFEVSTVRTLGQYIKTAALDKYNTIDPVEKKDYYPMAPAQKRMYILQEITPDSINYNMPLFTTLVGFLEKSKLENAFRELIYRHDSLRTSFHMVNSKPVQRVHDEVTFEIDYYKGNADAEIIKNFVKPFDLSQAPFLRVGLLKTGKENHLLLVDMHHSISDGRSFEIFLAELLALYRGEKMPGLRLQYKDFSQWLEKPAILDELRKQEAYWLNRLTNLPVLKLPTDYPRPEEKTYAGTVITFEIHGMAAEKLRALATAEEATLFMVILTIFNILLFKLGCQEDIVLGTLVTGRRCLDLENIIGMFVNTLVLRNHPGNDKTFKEFLWEVKKTTLEAFDRQDYPFDDLVEKLEIKREPGRNPLFDVLFLFNSVSASEENKLEVPGLKIKPLEEKSLQAKFDLLFTGRDSGENENLLFFIEYSTELFKKEQIERFITYFKEIVSAVTENEVIILKDIKFAHGLARVASDFNLREESGFEL